jgi:hypothetical protein
MGGKGQGLGVWWQAAVGLAGGALEPCERIRGGGCPLCARNSVIQNACSRTCELPFA